MTTDAPAKTELPPPPAGNATDHQYASLEWVDDRGNQKKLKLQGPPSFVSYWLKNLASSAVDKKAEVE